MFLVPPVVLEIKSQFPIKCVFTRSHEVNNGASQVAPVVKHLPANMGDVERDVGSIPGSERAPGGGHGNPLQYSCLKNPKKRGAWRATVHSIANSQT